MTIAELRDGEIDRLRGALEKIAKRWPCDNADTMAQMAKDTLWFTAPSHPAISLTSKMLTALRSHGLAIVPIVPTEEMLNVVEYSALAEDAAGVWRDMIFECLGGDDA